MTATPIPIPFLRGWVREARGVLLSGAAYPPHTRATALRFLRGLHPDVRALCCDDGKAARVGDGAEGAK